VLAVDGGRGQKGSSTHAGGCGEHLSGAALPLLCGFFRTVATVAEIQVEQISRRHGYVYDQDTAVVQHRALEVAETHFPSRNRPQMSSLA